MIVITLLSVVMLQGFVYGAEEDAALTIPLVAKSPLPDKPVSSVPAGAAEVIAYVDKSTITIGEKVKYTVEVISDKDAEVSFPAYTAQMGGFAVKDFGQEDPRKAGRDKVKWISWYLLDTYTTGSYVIPPQPVEIKLRDGKSFMLKSPEIFVEVKSVMQEGAEAEEEGLRDLKAPLLLPAQTPFWIFGALFLLVLSAGGGIGWYFYRKHLWKTEPPPPRPAHELALEELDRIEQMDLIAKRQIKEYYYLVSNCLRKYLEDRFGIRAPEQTTEEFLDSVTKGQLLDGRFVNILKEYLAHCDLVKYAKMMPTAEEIRKALETTRHFIEETKPAPVVSPVAEDGYEEEVTA
ncbi:MAG: hypothetical protein HY587_04365 [Candidatus Omnitrophica bacterium]|nr:hypothetical protein [Candidatus Omnitrophota bacterium]